MQKLICVVDDDKAFRLLCARVLEPAGYSCVSIDDGRRTLEEVKRIRPDLLMMDLRLGELDGLEVLNALDADPEVTGIPVVICTAAHDLVERHRERLDELGCEVVEKPFDVDDLLGAIERCLARAAARGRYHAAR
jgi:CheY-like chemotaxis protein